MTENTIRFAPGRHSKPFPYRVGYLEVREGVAFTDDELWFATHLEENHLQYNVGKIWARFLRVSEAIASYVK